MSIINTNLTNTILIPSLDSLVSGHQLANTNVGKNVRTFNNKFEDEERVESRQFQVFINSGSKSVLAGLCEDVKNLSVKRNTDTKISGGNGSYIVKLPGAISYHAVTFTHFYCDNDVFMNWLINGSGWGGVQKADIEIRVGAQGKNMVYTLRDAFPTAWHLGTMSINPEGLVTNTETVSYTLSEDQIMVENVTIAYSRLDYKHEIMPGG